MITALTSLLLRPAWFSHLTTTYKFLLFNLSVCEEVQAKEKEIDEAISPVLVLPEGIALTQYPKISRD